MAPLSGNALSQLSKRHRDVDRAEADNSDDTHSSGDAEEEEGEGEEEELVME